MPFKEQQVEDLRRAFVAQAQAPDSNVSAVCREFAVSRTTGYRLLARAAAGEDLADRSRRPHRCPHQSSQEVETRILALRTEHPTWGGRKLARWLRDHGVIGVPAPSTITAILERHGCLPPESERTRPWQRFVADAPNDLWQLDFKGPVRIGETVVYPLSILDDHSRFLVGLQLGTAPTDAQVRAVLRERFAQVGLPQRILTDNGPPWGSTHPTQPWTALNFWWIRQGIAVSHGRPYHPQTQGKVERVHRTMGHELFADQQWPDVPQAQQVGDTWRTSYNQDRPHGALALATPASCYAPSDRRFVEPLPPIVYPPGDRIVRVHGRGQIMVEGRELFLTGALIRESVALRPTEIDGIDAVYYCDHRLGQLDRRGSQASWRIERTDGRRGQV